jgi:hypothetical protein
MQDENEVKVLCVNGEYIPFVIPNIEKPSLLQKRSAYEYFESLKPLTISSETHHNNDEFTIPQSYHYAHESM